MLYIILILAIVGIDQVAKIIVQQELFQRSISIIPGVFNLTYVENRGAAFGIFQNMQIIFAIIAAAVTIVGLVCIFKKKWGKLVNISICMIIGGAIGNTIDRLKLGYVVDFLDFRFIWNYVFNIADVFVVLGTIILCIMMIKDERKNSKES